MSPDTADVPGLRDRLTKGAAWLAVTRMVVNLASFANTLLLARLLVPGDFGLVALATTVSTIISSVTELSLASALVQHKDPHEEHYQTAWTLNALRGCAIALAIAASAIPVARIYGDRRLVAVMLVIAASTWLSGLLNPKFVVFSRDLLFRQEFFLSVSQRLAGLAAAVGVALVYRSYWALIASIVATQVTALTVSYVLKPFRPRFRMTRTGDLLSFSVWLTLAQVVNTFNYKFDQMVIGFFLGAPTLGFYTVGDSLAVLPTREATTPLAQILFPGFVRLNADRLRLQKAYQRSQAFLCAVGLPVGFGFAAIAKPLMLLTMGAKWLPVVFVIQYLSCIFALQTLSSALQPLAMAMGETRRLFGRDVLNLVVRMPLLVVGLYTDGLAGIVFARCLSGMASNLLNMALVRRLLGVGLRAQLMANSRSMMGVIVMMAGMYGASLIVPGRSPLTLSGSIAVMTVTGATLYIAVSYILWCASGRPNGPESEAIHLLSRVIRKHGPHAPAYTPAGG